LDGVFVSSGVNNRSQSQTKFTLPKEHYRKTVVQILCLKDITKKHPLKKWGKFRSRLLASVSLVFICKQMLFHIGVGTFGIAKWFCGNISVLSIEGKFMVWVTGSEIPTEFRCLSSFKPSRSWRIPGAWVYHRIAMFGSPKFPRGQSDILVWVCSQLISRASWNLKLVMF